SASVPRPPRFPAGPKNGVACPRSVSNDSLSQYIRQDGAPLFDLVVADRERRQEPDNMAVGGIDQQPSLDGSGNDFRGINGQIKTDHRARDADLADQGGELAPEGFKLFTELGSNGGAPLEQSLGLDGFDRGQAGAAGNRIAAKGRCVHSRLEY